MRKKPLIGITGYHVPGEEGVGGTFRGVKGQGFSVIGHDYIQAVKQVGAIPIGIPVGDRSTCSEILQAIDGLILAGGEDIDPQLYGSSPDLRCWTITPERDYFELALIEEALRLHKPILAICRGMQLLNVCFGGTLYVDISDHGEHVLAHQFSRAPRWYLGHRVKLLTPSLKKLYQANEIRTNSYHHQAVNQLGAGLEAAAVADDGIIEALIHPNHPNLLAVQWHPEMMAVKHEEGLIPFRWLIDQVNGGGSP
ncbi:gamma-glutamyl-gamma-aminobutyrate hydrolase family protein [Paenibacillus roseipurpureus]|uniref:Gamma-glutamyl-gamma-aminobutyrate hydrolase family protein n=1 Tax=Paenibacillus roseopurpureus TaxID=2918901 RepID=A0AA96RMZ2_9BACL|nr:gamma-glutamyl-gamma-aminobutyrate hydrolase family protein [Paenibacillus sp. MBLB1832]WNR46926.1 gamma-glutamyl-gamma-aminobutyrate hydrolase family protein [Paenibacillus sp. MBLB1832]